MPLIDCVAGDGDCSPVRLFNNGEKITNSIIIPDGVKKIASAAFNGSYDIKSIIIPNSVEIIEYLAFFFSCIDKIYCTSVTPPVAPYLGINLEDTELKIYVPRKSVAAYKRAAGWSRYAASIVGYDFNTTKQVPANKPRSASER